MVCPYRASQGRRSGLPQEGCLLPCLGERAVWWQNAEEPDRLVWEGEPILPHQAMLLGPPWICQCFQMVLLAPGQCEEECCLSELYSSPSFLFCPKTEKHCWGVRGMGVVEGGRGREAPVPPSWSPQQGLFQLRRRAGRLHTVRLFSIISWRMVLIRQMFYPAQLVLCPWRGKIQGCGTRMFV